MSGIEVSPFFSPFTLQALNNDIVVQEIISYLGPNLHDLIKYRAVCHKWNDLIVRKINKCGPSLHIPLRYGPEIPLLSKKSNARRWAQEILENVSITLTGTASRLLFNTIVVDNDFYLGGVVFKWKCFLEAHGESIRHLKFKIRSQEFPKPSENHVTDCEEMMTMKDLVSTFSATPNLESLYFSIRFSNYSSGSATQPKPKPTVLGNLPILHKLTHITIREPKGISYPDILLRNILGMAPNLTSLCIKPSSVLSTHAAVMNSMNQGVIQSLTSLKISNAHITEFYVDPRNVIYFPSLHLTSIELNNIVGWNGVGRNYWFKRLLLTQRTSLIKLVLGNQRNSNPLSEVEHTPPNMNPTGLCFVQFPPVMDHLKFLEVNVSKFRPFWNDSYKIQFPTLHSFTMSGARETGDEDGNEWTLGSTLGLLTLTSGRSDSLKQFSLIGPIHKSSQTDIITAVQMTFPKAEWEFHSESDRQCSLEVERDLSLYYEHIKNRLPI